jgi:hypothetical protein
VSNSTESFVFDIMDIPDLPPLTSHPLPLPSLSVRAAVQQANQKDAVASSAPAAAVRPPAQRRPSIGAQGQTSKYAPHSPPSPSP